MKIQTENMTAQLITKGVTKTLSIVMTVVCIGLLPVHAQEQVQAKAKTQYNVSTLPDFGGTSTGGNSINDQSWAAGYSRLPNRNRHATLWRNGVLSDLGTLGGPNSSVTWNVKNTPGIIVGISQTADPQLLGESWSSAFFYSRPNNVGDINLGVVWQHNHMRGLPNFPAGKNGFSTGPNNSGQGVGRAEHGVRDPQCCCRHALQSR